MSRRTNSGPSGRQGQQPSNGRKGPSPSSPSPSPPPLELFQTALSLLSSTAAPLPLSKFTPLVERLQTVPLPISKLPPLDSGRLISLLYSTLSSHLSLSGSKPSSPSLLTSHSKACAFVLHLLSNQKNADIASTDLDGTVAFLTAQCLAAKPCPDYSTLRTLSKLLTQFGNRTTSSENTADTVVRQLMLPLITSGGSGGGTAASTGSNNNAASHQSQQNRSAALDCLTGLLRHSKHASSLFSPLVVTVNSDGSELTVPNPLALTLGILERSYVSAVLGKSGKEITSTARALTAAVDALSSLRSSPSIPLTLPLLVPSLADALSLPPSSSSDKPALHTLSLLSSLAKHYPHQLVPYYDSFLPSPSTVPAMWKIVQKEGEGKEREMALECAGMVVKGMPLAAWLNATVNTTSSSAVGGGYVQGYVQPRDVRNLPVRVKKCLLAVLSTVAFALPTATGAAVRSLCTLAQTTVTCAPSTSDAAIVEGCGKVLSAVAAVLFRPKAGAKAAEAAASCLAACFGDGAVPPPPAAHFLAHSGDSVLKSLLLFSQDASRTADVRLPHYRLLGKMGRVDSRRVLAAWNAGAHEGGGVKECVRAGIAGSEDRKLRAAAAGVLEQALAGRQEGAAAAAVVDASVEEWLLAALADSQDDVRATAAAACGHLTAREWSRVGAARVAERGGAQVERSAAVRASCFKALGRFFSARFTEGEEGEGTEEEVAGISKALLSSAEDESCNVRAMVQFAIGNLAQALAAAGTASSREVLDGGLYRKLCECALKGMGDFDERVVASAIRAAGMLLRVNANAKASGGDGGGGEQEELDGKAVRVLGGKIELALGRGTDKNLEKDLNSRQRYSINKHAWGSCSALSSVGVEKSRDREAVALLARCLSEAGNLKVRLAAAAALGAVIAGLRAAEEGGAASAGRDRGCFWRVVLECLKERDDEEVGGKCRELLWSALCVCRSGTDMAGSIRRMVELEGGLEWLYGFCVAKGEEAGAGGGCGDRREGGGVFGVIVQAFKEIDWETFWGEESAAVDVGILQKFNSRASLEQRLERNKRSPKESRLVRSRSEEETAEAAAVAAAGDGGDASEDEEHEDEEL